ncbi:MAG: DUF126 domain-containing protein [Chloroflexota bacterium]
MKNMTLKGRGITGGIAEGEALVTGEAFSFAHGLDPVTGELTDAEIRDWVGQNAKGKVLVFPYGKGSSLGGLYICQAANRGNAPAAVINVKTDPVIAVGFLLCGILYQQRIPVVDSLEKNPIEAIRTGDRIRVDADRGTVEIIEPTTPG